jgi:hypothetical protein
MKNIMLHKSNQLVRGTDRLSIHGKRLVNAIYYLIQINVNKGNIKAIEETAYIPIEFPYLRKMMGLEKVESYIKEIESAFVELQQPIQLNNFKNPRDGKLYNWYSISMISEASWSIDNNKKIAYISLAPLIKWLMINTNDGNFTKLELIPIINKLRTKYAMKLYEYLKSFSNYRYLDISQAHLMRLFGIDEDNKTYKNYSDLRRLLERQIKELISKSDLQDLRLDDDKQLKKDKVFRIHINAKASKKTVSKKDMQQLLESLSVKRF